MTDLYLTISLSTHNEDDTPQNNLHLLYCFSQIYESCIL